MATPSGSVILDKSIDYEQKALIHGKYQYVPYFPNTYGAPINLTSGQTPVTLNLPTDVFNLGKSELLYTVVIAAPSQGDGNYNWISQDTISEISHIQFYGSNNQFICDLDNLQNYSKIVIPHEMSLSEYMSNDPVNKLYPSNTVNNTIPALRVMSSVLTSAPTASSLNYTEPAYYVPGGNNAPVQYNVQIPLRNIRNTILAMDKSFYFNQITYMKIYFGPITKIGFVSTSNQSPNGSGAIINDLTTTGSTITNLQLMLAIEQETESKERIKRDALAGMSVIIPFATSYKNNSAGASQNINLQLDAGSGKSLVKMYHSLFNVVENYNTQYDCSNQWLTTIVNGVAANTTNEKVNMYYTNLNGTRQQTITIDCTNTVGQLNNLDYMNIKNDLRCSVLQNMNIFKYHWHHLDDFSSISNKDIHEGNTDIISGFPLGPTPVTWTFVGQSLAPALVAGQNQSTFQHYTWGIYTKRLTINSSGPTVD